ncbi:M56 family metallopeptidase [Maricaulis alexandrii]|uniref:M56 family metallopeptidase n=1 Tax=Maricaulis alexandrii TaxID=2570354 RepID=UPI001108FDBA|nr:M56 family metallopeptidase [Maricaulis alexandrii]
MMMSVLQAAGLTLIGATLLAGLVKAFDRWAPRRMVRERHDLALAAFLTVPLIFVAAVLPSPARDAVTVPVYQVQGAADATASEPAKDEHLRELPELPVFGAEPGAAGLPVDPVLIAQGALALWGGISLFLVLRLILDLMALRGFIRRAHPVERPDALALSRDLPLVRSREVAGPMLAGFLRPVILVPEGFALDAKARPILEHEIAHARRGDTWTALGLRLLDVAFWWVLPLRVLPPVLDTARETLCDREAVRLTGQPRLLAGALLDTAAAAIRTPSLALAAAPTRSGLARRIHHLTSPDLQSRKDSVMRFALILPALAAGSLVLTPNVGAVVDVSPAPSRALDDALDLDVRLFHAARRGRDRQVEQLLEEGANPNVAFRGDGTALTAAVSRGHSEIVARLLEAGADPDLGVRGDGSPLIKAAARGDRAMAERLIAFGADVDSAWSGDGNALIAAARRGQTDMASLLLEAGADPNAYVRGDETPLINAAQQGRREVAELLVEAGADVSLTVLANRREGANEYRSPISEARRNGHRDMVRWLESLGATHNPPSE